MYESLIVAASAMDSVYRELDSVTHNAVNSHTPGYQRHELVTRSFGSCLDQAGGRERLVGGEEVLVFNQGELHQTDEPYAMALEGDGFFVVRGSDGNDYYTRNGQFTLDAQGQLITHAGYPVQGDGGSIFVDPTLGSIMVEDDGAVLQAGAEVGRVRVVEFDPAERDQMTKAGETLYTVPDGVNPGPNEGTLVRHGFHEIQPYGMKATVKMLVSSKSFDSMQRTIRTIDEIQQQLIRSVQ